jgi:glutamate synthase (ferredoxin)
METLQTISQSLIQPFSSISGAGWFGIITVASLIALAIRDRFFSKDNIIRNFPVIGHLRYLLIEIGPELRQYIVANNREEEPFNREERQWIYHSAKGENNLFGFGTDDQIYGIGYPIIKHAVFPFGDDKYSASIHDKKHAIACAKILGEAHGRQKSWRPGSIINISAMSFGSLSANAIAALNEGAMQAGCYHNTGEGGLSPFHQRGADVIYQIGTGYFGCRDKSGNFSLDELLKTLDSYPKVRGLEIKLSQGAKPGKGGVLPGKKVTEQIARIRGVEAYKDCLSPNSHQAFHDASSLIEFVEKIAKETGLPVGIKSAIGKMEFWQDLSKRMRETGRGPDWITIDGGEGGTGAAPLTFADHVSLPFKVGFTRVYKTFLDQGIADQIVWVGSGKLGFPDRAIVAFSLGVDLINIAREAMLSIGCIQAQKCHTDRCPAGVATQSPWLQRAIEPKVQSLRFARFCQSLRNEILAVTHACGYEHPSQFKMTDIELSSGPGIFVTLKDIYGYENVRK